MGTSSARIWRRAVFDICFGLVGREIRAATAGASQEEQVAPDIGELDGRKIQMLVHHSRNSARKQWDETETLALSGVGRLLRAHFDAVAKFDGFDKRFEWYLQWVTQSVAQGSRRYLARRSNRYRLCLRLAVRRA